MYGAHVYTQVRGHTFRTPKQHPSSSSHHQVRSACSASTRGESDTCTPYTRDATQPSLSSWPSFGRQAWSDHRNPSAYGRNDAYPGQTRTPYRPCTGSPCGDCRLLVTDTRPCCIHTCASGTSYPCSMSCGSLGCSPSSTNVSSDSLRNRHVLLTDRCKTRR